VINNQTVITGSYNWSASADKRNWENLLVIQSYEIAADRDVTNQQQETISKRPPLALRTNLSVGPP
jgi:phosphatidylserine/phosphatidylglycerophosphate/cardiolipin synthase-like enzyme